MPQSTGNKLLDWRLKNGVMNAKDDALKRAVSSCEYLSERCVGIVVAGLVIELAIAWCHPSYDSFVDRWGSFIADCFVTIGVIGELFFSAKGSAAQEVLRLRADDRAIEADKKLSDALNRAARAEEQLAPRNVTKEQFEELQSLKGKIGKAVWITTPSDFGSARFALQISQALLHAGIDMRIAQQRIGMIWTELYIVLPELVADFKTVPLFATLSKAGFSVGCGVRAFTTLGDIPMDDIVLMVGVKKPVSGDVPPFMAGLP